MLLQFFLLATTVAVFLAYRVSGAPALRLMGLAGGLLLFRALPEFMIRARRLECDPTRRATPW